VEQGNESLNFSVYPTIWEPAPTGATIARATYFTPPDPVLFFNGTPSIGVDPLLKLVTVPYFYSNGTMPDLNVNCPTSNCTFEPFETLAVCGTCKPISNILEFGCFHGPADWLSNFTSYTGPLSLVPNITHCGYFLNSTDESRVLMSGYAVDPTTLAPGEALTTRWFALIDAITKQPYFDGSILFKDIVNPIADFLVVGTPGGAEAVYQNKTPAAHECYLTWCTQTLESSFSWGMLSENKTSEWLNSTKTPYPYTFTPDGQYYYLENTTLVPPNQHLAPGQKGELVFGLSNNTGLSTSFLADSVQLAFVTAESESAALSYKWDNAVASQSRSLLANPWLDTDNITQHFQKITEAMTRAVRNTPATNGTLGVVNGIAWESKVHVQIRWPWMILPLALLAISLLFLLMTMIKSSREEKTVGIWKCSAIAILFNGLGEDVQRSVSPNCRMGEARAKARELRVKLLPE
jgi:hypothetical protein